MKQITVFVLRLVLIYLIILFYAWTTTVGTFKFYPKNNNYNLLSIAFLHGQLNLPVQVPKALLKLSDPYDPILNKESRMMGIHDFSLYNKKLYLYFGATPALILFIPYKLITKKIMPYNMAIFIFSTGILIWSFLILLHLKKKYFNSIPEWFVFLSTLIIGIANGVAVLLRRPDMYEVAIASGCFFLTGAIYFLCLSINNPSLLKLFIAGLFLGFSVGSRPHFVFSGICLILLFCFYFRKSGFNHVFKLFATLAIPFSFIVFLILLYNYFRFGNIFEFGVKYQLAGMNSHLYSLFGLKNILGKIHLTLYCAPSLSPTFPFIYPKFWMPPSPPFPPGETTPERVAGLIPSVPFVLLLLIGPLCEILLRLFNKTKELIEIIFPIREFLIILIPGLINLFFLFLYTGSVLRYNVDFFNYFILASILIWFYFDRFLNKNGITRNFLRIFALMFGIVSILNGISYSILGSCNDFRSVDPEQFHRIKSYFKPVSDFLYLILKQ